jgi:hypothetical protein
LYLGIENFLLKRVFHGVPGMKHGRSLEKNLRPIASVHVEHGVIFIYFIFSLFLQVSDNLDYGLWNT